MSTFNNDDYLAGQVKKQVQEVKTSDCKIDLNINTYNTSIDILDMTIEQIQNKVKKGVFTYEEVTKYYLNRIQTYSDYNSVIEVNEQAVMAAKRKVYDPLNDMMYGIPVLIKGNIGSKDMHTTAGAEALKDFVCDDDAEIVKNLKKKGAIILGMTNLSEWANFMSTESSNGYSALGGQSKNPYGPYDVGASSSGSAVATACQLAAVAIGTETAGSIIYPSSQNGIVGLKPSLGIVSNDRIIPISKTHDTAGPMGKTVKDTYYLFNALVDNNETIVFDKEALNKKKVGLVINNSVKGYYRNGDVDILERVKEQFARCKADVEEILLDEEAFETKVYDILKYEFREGVKDFLSLNITYPIKSLNDIILFNERDMDRYAPYNHEIMKQANDETFDEEVIGQQIKINQKLTRSALDQALETYDVLLTLSNYCTSVYAPAGYPALTLPGNYRESGEPIGITLIGKHLDDMTLFKYAYAFEQVVTRKSPKLERSVYEKN